MSRRRENASNPVRAVERLATLLGAGVPISTCWRLLAESAPEDSVLAAADAASERGDPVGSAITQASAFCTDQNRTAWAATAAAVAVAESAGAPLSAALEVVSARLRSIEETGREIAVAMAGPRMTMRLVMAMPGLGILGSTVMGFDSLGTLIGDPYGRAAGIAGLLLLVLGALWARRLSRRAQPRRQAPGFSLELVAIAVRGGGALEQACRSVERECERHSLPFEREAIEDCLRLADRAGAPVAGLLRAEAALLRSVVGAEDRTRAAALGVTLLLPLGVCVLPAFMLLAIAPTILAVVASTLAGF